MTIITKKYNDFSSISYDDRRDFDKLLKLIDDFVSGGGDITLPIKVSSRDTGFDLVSLRDFITSNISESEKFLRTLTEKGIAGNPFELFYDSNKKTISCVDGQSINDLKRGLDTHPKLIIESIENLMKSLPNDYNEIKGYEGKNYSGNVEVSNKETTIFTMADTINNPDVYRIIFSKFPQIKKEWDFVLKDGIKYYTKKMECRWDECGDYEVTKVFITEGIASDYVFEKPKLCQDIIKLASRRGDIEFLNKLLPNINLREAESGLYSYNLSLPCSKNKEVAELLIKHGALAETEIVKSDPKDNYKILAIFAEELKSPEVLDVILSNFSKYSKMVKDEPENFYKHYQTKNPEFLKILIKKYGLSTEKLDLISICAEDEILTKEFLDLGMDVRNNKILCQKMVSEREKGLKTLRLLNKSGVLKSNSPEVIYNILNNSPTKAFINYIQKFGAESLNAETIDGNIAWWGVTNTEHMQTAVMNGADIELNTKNGKSFLYHVFESKKIDRRNAQALFSLYLRKMTNKKEDFQIETNWVNEDNENILHKLMKSSRYDNEKINESIYDIIKEKGTVNIYDLLNSKNKNNKTPLENLLKSDSSINHEIMYIVEDVLENSDNKIKFNTLLSDGETLAERITKLFKGHQEIITKLSAIKLTQELTEQTTENRKRMKI